MNELKEIHEKVLTKCSEKSKIPPKKYIIQISKFCINTKVVNVKVQYIRPMFNNLKEWCENENNIYIGRKGIVFINNKRFPSKDSFFANPFKVGKNMDNIDNIIDKYEKYIYTKIKENPSIVYYEFFKLLGKNLGCWCKDKNGNGRCHGDILISFLNKIFN